MQVLAGDFERRLRGHLETFDLVGVAGTTKLVGPKWFAAGPPHLFGQVAHLGEQPGAYTVSIYGAPARAVGNIQALDGLFFATRRAVLERVPFDAATFDGFHLYDIDFSFRAHREGLRVGVANDLYLLHASGGRFDTTWDRYAARFTRKHAAALPEFPPRRHRWAVVDVASLREAVEVMTPAYWEPADVTP